MSRETIPLIAATLQPPHGGAWHGGPTPITALRGVTAKAARWRPRGGKQSIWRLTLHIAYWKYTIRRHLAGSAGKLAGLRGKCASAPPRPDEAGWKADRALLADEHRQLLVALEQLDPAHLGRRPSPSKRWNWSEMAIGIAMHDAYHTGQIQMLKRLWKGSH